MARLKDAIAFDRGGYEPVEQTPPVIQIGGSFKNDFEPGYHPMIRCPLPPFAVTPDSLRSFYSEQVPQKRVIPPSTNNPQQVTVSNVTTIVNAAATSVSSSGSGSSSSSSTDSSSVGAVTTPQLAPGEQYQASVQMAIAFQLLSAAADNPCRIRIYGSQAASDTDLGRAVDAPPAPGTTQGLISDVVLDSIPYEWDYEDRVGNNIENPRTDSIYVTVSNTGSAAEIINVTLTFVAL